MRPVLIAWVREARSGTAPGRCGRKGFALRRTRPIVSSRRSAQHRNGLRLAAWFYRGGRDAFVCCCDGIGRRPVRQHLGHGFRPDCDRRQRREERGRREPKADRSRARPRHLDGARHLSAGDAKDCRDNPADEFGRRAADQPRDHALGRDGARRQLADAGGRRLEPQARSRQQGLSGRSEGEPAQGRRHGHGRQAALGHGDQPQRRPGARRQPRRRHDLGAVDPRQGRAGRRHRQRRRAGRWGRRRRHHPRRQARSGAQARRQQGGAVVDRRRQGQIRQAGSARPGSFPTMSP